MCSILILSTSSTRSRHTNIVVYIASATRRASGPPHLWMLHMHLSTIGWPSRISQYLEGGCNCRVLPWFPFKKSVTYLHTSIPLISKMLTGVIAHALVVVSPSFTCRSTMYVKRNNKWVNSNLPYGAKGQPYMWIHGQKLMGCQWSLPFHPGTY